jgi:hypothetical protein
VNNLVNVTRCSNLSAFASVILYVLVLAFGAFAQTSGNGADSTTPRSYNLGDTLFVSAIGKNETPFTPLSLWNFGEGWLEPWIPPPNGELHLQRGGWVNTASGFFSRELDPAFTFNAGTSGTRDEYIGAASLFVPLNRRLQIGLFVPFVDSLQSNASVLSQQFVYKIGQPIRGFDRQFWSR